MKVAICLAVFALAAGSAMAKGAGGSHAVKGHVTKSGKYVAPHHATNPNGIKADNWSTKGNVNPRTGKEGTKSP